MEILYLLIPMSMVLVFVILAVLYWAVESGQFEDIEAVGQKTLNEAGAEAETDFEPNPRVV
jgi:cbb3-type cytochrome oxidase maturation protein